MARRLKRIVIAGPPGDDAFGSVAAVADALARALPKAETVVTLQPEALSARDGLILPGGVPDVDPALYGEENRASRRVDPALDQAQLRMLDQAVELGIPVLGICRGFQLMNVHFGGSLIQDGQHNEVHRADRSGNAFHSVQCVGGTFLGKLYGHQTVVNTLHHQCIGRLAPQFAVSQMWFADCVPPRRREELYQAVSAAAAEDLTGECAVEGICHQTLPLFGVQWHPELMGDGEGRADPDRLFSFFYELPGSTAF